MRIVFAFLISAILLFSCNNNDKTPDVSNVKIELATQHFEHDLFNIDTLNSYEKVMSPVFARYPSFSSLFMVSVLNCDPTWPLDTLYGYVKGFIRAYKQVYDTTQIVFKDFAPYEKEVKKALQFLKYYFPDYKGPKKLITYIGPLDGYGDILSEDALIIALQHHLGRNYSLYRSALVQQTYPEYISYRFEPGYIAVNCMKIIISDLYPEKPEDKPLVEQMVEKGKRLFLLSKLLPGTEEYKLIGYKKEQLEAAYEHEAAIWDLFVQNNFLQTIDNSIIKNYIGEGPKTQELGEASPGNIGSFTGWQIVKKFMQKNSKFSLQQLMDTNAETIFQEAKYKP